MSTETTATETKVETIATQPEKETLAQTTDVDYEAELQKVNARLAKTQEEKENYRKAYLKKANQQDEGNDTPQEDLDSKVSRLVKEQLLATQEAQVQAEKETLISSLAKKNKELTLALKNRSQVTNTSGQGSNEDKPEVKTDSYFSTEQLRALRAKGYDDKKIEALKQNMMKGVQQPK